MVEVFYDDHFKKVFSKIKDKLLKERVLKQINKIIENPITGKPMMYARKGTREVYVSPFRLVYSYFDNKIIFHDLYHKDEQ